ncbi:uncharacterized protein LOC113311985 [Papaver somniferum]|uniref:uncharacterized protein LOC113311985 n=1 Tax=Papaver somniferum TaxID=3469 RepID=UPI000E702D0E|nr:uncharacterized protein LOC113311985 [Papaver somniferum]
MFYPDLDKVTRAAVWVSFTNLPREFWDEETLFRMARGLGKDVVVDPRTLRYEYGYFAAVLIGIDLSQPLGNIIVDGEESAEGFYADYEIINQPSFCEHCKSVGHVQVECRIKQRKDLEENAKVEKDPEIKKKIQDGIKDLKNFWQLRKYDKKNNVPVDPLSIRDDTISTSNNNCTTSGLRNEGDNIEKNDDATFVRNDSAEAVASSETDMDLEEAEEIEAIKAYEDLKKKAIELDKAADMAKLEEVAAKENMDNLRRLALEKRKQIEVQTPSVRIETIAQGSLPTNYILEQLPDYGFSPATKAARRTIPEKTVDAIVTSNMFDTGTDDLDDEGKGIFSEVPPDVTHSVTTSNPVEDETKNLESSAMKDQKER